MYTLMGQELITMQGWSSAIKKHSWKFEEAVMAEFLCNTSEALSTHGELLSKVLQDKTVPEMAIQDLLQACSYCLPTEEVVSQNKKGTTLLTFAPCAEEQWSCDICTCIQMVH